MGRRPLKQMGVYLESLPQGLASYPEYQQKASIYRLYTEETAGLEVLAPALPDPLRALLDTPVVSSAWIPEVHATCLYLAIADLNGLSEEDLFEDWLLFNRRLLSHRLYRMLLRVASPQLTIRGAGYRWGAFHRGLLLKVSGDGAHRMKVEMDSPEHLVPRIIAAGYGAAFRVAAEMAGAKKVQVTLAEHTSIFARWESRWAIG